MRRPFPSLTRAAFRSLSLIASVSWLTLVGACGGGDVDMTVRKPASQRPDLDQGMAASGSLSIPAAQRFNITSFKSGQDGAARGESKPAAADGAECRAEARDGGSAWSEFQLGYCFDNVAKVPLSAAVRLRLKVNESSSIMTAGASPAGSPGDGSKNRTPTTTRSSSGSEDGGSAISAAKTLLKFFIKDTSGLVVKEQSLLADNMDKGPHSISDIRDAVFDARFEPDRGYYLVIAGRTEAQAAMGESVQSALGVSQCSLEIVWQGAAAPGAADPAGAKAIAK